MEEEILTTAELCKWLKVSRETVANWRAKGMPYMGIGKALRYRKNEVEEWFKRQQAKKN